MHRVSMIVSVASFALCLGSACGAIAVLEEEGSGGAGGGAVTGTGVTTGSKASSTVTKSASSQTGMVDLCQAPVGAPCDPGTFPRCEEVEVDGIPCCHITKSCGPSGVEWMPAFCTDNCAQACDLIQNPEHCEAVAWCVLGPDGCESPPPPP